MVRDRLCFIIRILYWFYDLYAVSLKFRGSKKTRDGPRTTDHGPRTTDRASYRDAWTHLKMANLQPPPIWKFQTHPTVLCSLVKWKDFANGFIDSVRITQISGRVFSDFIRWGYPNNGFPYLWFCGSVECTIRKSGWCKMLASRCCLFKGFVPWWCLVGLWGSDCDRFGPPSTVGEIRRIFIQFSYILICPHFYLL